MGRLEAMILKLIDRDWLVSNFEYSIVTGCFYDRHTGLVATVTDSNGYNLLHSPSQQKLRAARAVFCYLGLTVPDVVDHVNRDRKFDAWLNLRDVTPQVNSLNRKLSSNSSTKITGVSYCMSSYSWEVKLQEKRLGRRKDFFEACCLRKSAEYKLLKRLELI